MKKFFIIAGMILAIMMVVQPTYAAKHFNINVTVSTFSMELLRIDGTPYMEWPVTVPPSTTLTMAAHDAVMISLTGDLPDNSVDIFTSVDNENNWNPILPGMTLLKNDFILEVSAMNFEPTEPLTVPGFKAITQDTMEPAMTIPTNGLQEAAAYLIYKIKVGDDYDDFGAGLDVKIEAIPSP
jgi:hypothetical protein